MRRMIKALITAVATISFVACGLLCWQRGTGRKWHYSWSVTRVPYQYRGVTAFAPARFGISSYDLIYLNPDRRIDIEIPFSTALLATALIPAAWLAWMVAVVRDKRKRRAGFQIDVLPISPSSAVTTAQTEGPMPKSGNDVGPTPGD